MINLNEVKKGMKVLVDMKSVMPSSTLDSEGRFLVEGIVVGSTNKRVRVENLVRGVGLYKPENIYLDS
tara:strand:- start:4273 stop:4476 length:204 start_codon:yes stop_codon:yes gene_type:complete